ncbi:hypothetical protein ACFLQW_00645 [Candidatus Zixiibacteriota bacterium]
MRTAVAMEFLNSPTNLLIVGIGFVVLYSLSQYIRNQYGEFGKLIGFGGTALVILKLFWSFCPTVAVYHLFPLLAIAIISQFVFWAVRKIRNLSKPRRRFNFDNPQRSSSDNSLERSSPGQDSILSEKKQTTSRPVKITRIEVKSK